MRYGIDLLQPTQPTTFGSANWLTPEDAHYFKLNENIGPILGYLPPRPHRGLDYIPLYANDKGHMMTVAPTRAGKGTCHIVPNLLSWKGSCIVLDVKGENFALTNKYRLTLGRVIRFSPFEDGGEKWNPIDQIRIARNKDESQMEEQEDVRYLANLLVTPYEGAKDPYWENAAKSLIQGILLYVATADIGKNTGQEWHPRARTMAEFRRLLVLAPFEFKGLLQEMKDSWHSWVAESATINMQTAESQNQFTGVLSTAMEQTSVWSYHRVARNTEKTDFSFDSLRDSKSPATVYLVIPPEALTEYRSILRVMIGWAIRQLRLKFVKTSHESQMPVLFVLDEFPQLANMAPIEEGLGYLAGYGVKLWFFIQDISQIQQHYPKTWKSFFANSGTRCFFGVSDIETAKLVSEMSGQGTVLNTSYQHTSGESEQVSYTSGPEGRSVTRAYGGQVSSTNNYAHIGRPLITPGEAMCLGIREQIVFMKHLPAIRCRLLPYHEHEKLKNRAGAWGGQGAIGEG